VFLALLKRALSNHLALTMLTFYYGHSDSGS